MLGRIADMVAPDQFVLSIHINVVLVTVMALAMFFFVQRASKSFCERLAGLLKVVLVLRPVCSPVKVDQGFMSGCHSHRFCFARIGLVWGQDAVGRVGSFGVVIGQPFSDAGAGL